MDEALNVHLEPDESLAKRLPRVSVRRSPRPDETQLVALILRDPGPRVSVVAVPHSQPGRDHSTPTPHSPTSRIRRRVVDTRDVKHDAIGDVEPGVLRSLHLANDVAEDTLNSSRSASVEAIPRPSRDTA